MSKEKFITEDGTTIERQRCEVYTRVMGYHRPVSQWNTGKKAEHYNRKFFKEECCSSNREFNNNFSI